MPYPYSVLLSLPLIIVSPSLTSRDRFRTTVNVLGDTFGVGIVHHYTRKQLGPYPKPSLQRRSTSRDNLDSSSSETNESLHNSMVTQDYGSSSPPPPTLPHIPTPQWSLSSGGNFDTVSDHDGNGTRAWISPSSVEKIREETNL